MLTTLASDAYLFLALQVSIAAFALFAAIRSAILKRRAGSGSLSMVITRSENSMAVFYGAYGAATGLLVALSLSVDFASHHRVFWVLFDTVLVAYVCLFNAWFRNWLIGKTSALSKLEKR